jgi:hypothetical protein
VKSFDLAGLATAQGGEYALGARDLHSQACYLIYGTLEPGESGRLVRPGQGYEEILCPLNGPLVILSSRGEERLEKGHALHVKEDDSFSIANPSDFSVMYVLAGGRTDPHPA